MLPPPLSPRRCPALPRPPCPLKTNPAVEGPPAASCPPSPSSCRTRHPLLDEPPLASSPSLPLHILLVLLFAPPRSSTVAASSPSCSVQKAPGRPASLLSLSPSLPPPTLVRAARRCPRDPHVLLARLPSRPVGDLHPEASVVEHHEHHRLTCTDRPGAEIESMCSCEGRARRGKQGSASSTRRFRWARKEERRRTLIHLSRSSGTWSQTWYRRSCCGGGR